MDLRHVKDSSAGQNEPEDVNDVLTPCTSDEDHSPVKKMPRIDPGEKRDHGLTHRASSESEQSSPTVHGDIDVSISCASGSQEPDDQVDIFYIGMKESYSDFEMSSDDHSDYLEEVVDPHITNKCEQSAPHSASSMVSSPKELTAADIFQKYHKHLDRFTPSHLPGKPSSFQAYLKAVFLDSSQTSLKPVVERANVHSSLAIVTTYKDMSESISGSDLSIDKRRNSGR